jgi:putative endonuclease
MSASHAISAGASSSTGAEPSRAFTKKYKVHQLVYFEQFESILEARARERVLKHWRREWKFKLVEGLNPTWRDLTPELVNL